MQWEAEADHRQILEIQDSSLEENFQEIQKKQDMILGILQEPITMEIWVWERRIQMFIMEKAIMSDRGGWTYLCFCVVIFTVG